MFKLYAYIGKWQRDDLQSKEQVINKMITYSKKHQLYHFLIIEETEKGPITEGTLNEEDFLEYITSTKEEIKEDKDESCVSLKKSILKKKGYYN